MLLIVKRRHLAEEVLQEAYVRIWLNAAAYRSSLGSPMNWMTTIAKNLAIDVARKPAREIHSDHSAMLNFPLTAPRRSRPSKSGKAKARLSDYSVAFVSPCKHWGRYGAKLVIAAYIHGESRHRLSEQYGVPVSTIKTWIRRALLEVRASVGDIPPDCSDISLLISHLGHQALRVDANAA